MVSFTPCKINLGLRITARRTDGFHNIDSVFLPVPWYDILEFTKANDEQQIHHSISLSGIVPDGNPEHNLVLKACHILENAGYSIPCLNIFLHKTIPVGAGLGGGSSNGANMLLALNNFFNLNIGKQDLLTYAAELGSDCPFFIENSACYVTGRGEVLNPIELNLKGYHLVLANPGIHISTAEAFQSIQIKVPEITSLQVIQTPVSAWKSTLINDFQAGAIERYPLIGECIATLYEKGAVYAAMSGSGSTVFGLFESNPGTLFKNLMISKTIQL
jgi:4-diphosphocytidyl-2-C-methyl-D-erythritol kinase